MTKRITLAIAGDGGPCRLRGSASARWYGDGRWHDDDAGTATTTITLSLSRAAGGLRCAVQLRLPCSACNLRSGARHQPECPHSMS